MTRKSAFSRTIFTAALGLTLLAGAPSAGAETLRLLTWGGYASDEIVKRFEAKYPGTKVEVTLSNNEEIIAKLRATGGAGFDLAQPGFNRIAAAQKEFDIYKPMDLSKIETDKIDPIFLSRVKSATTIDGQPYSVPHLWGTSGLMVDKTKAADAKSFLDLCNAKYKGRTSMRLARTILIGTAFAMGEDPYAAYSDPKKYQQIMDKVAAKLIECKDIVKAYWKGGDDLANMMLSGEVVVAETWDATAYKLFAQNPNIVFVPPTSGAVGWIDSFALPKRGRADDLAYKWINFVMQPEIVTLMSANTGAIAAVKGGVDLLPPDKKAAVKAGFKTEADISNIKFAAPLQPGVEEIEGKTIERIKAATAK
jgi:spermidine/putrescine transport system substrate-binding protein